MVGPKENNAVVNGDIGKKVNFSMNRTDGSEAPVLEKESQLAYNFSTPISETGTGSTTERKEEPNKFPAISRSDGQSLKNSNFSRKSLNRYSTASVLSTPSKANIQFPVMDNDTEGAVSAAETEDGPMLTRAKRTDFTLRSQASSFSLGTLGDYSTWAESEEAKSSLVAVMSAMYAMVLVILSMAFEVSVVVTNSAKNNNHDVFYCYLYSVALLFFIYCELFLLRSLGTTLTITRALYSLRRLIPIRKKSSTTSSIDLPVTVSVTFAETEERKANLAFLRKRKQSMSLKRKASHSASSAGSLYLRMGCVVFGVVGLIMKGLQLFASFDGGDLPGCFSISWFMETALSAIFIFVQMFFIFQNSRLIIHRFRTVGRLGAMHLVATNLSMWIRSLVKEQMNILEEINEGVYYQSSHHQSSSHNTTIISHHADHISEECVTAGAHYNSLIADVEPFTTTCIVEYSLICAAVMYILWRNVGHTPKQRTRHRKQRFHVDCSSSTQGLFLGLFFMVYTIVSMVIFFTKVRSGDTEEALYVFYTTYLVLSGASIVALASGMLRMRKLFYIRAQKRNLLLDDILLIVGLTGQLMFGIFSVVPLNLREGGTIASMIAASGILRIVQVLWQTLFIFFAQRLTTMTPEMQEKNPGREMVTFLLMTNLASFLVNTFEIHKAAAIPHSFQFYGEGAWIVISHSTVPLCIFYRFHSTVCLAEIWKLVYRVKEVQA